MTEADELPSERILRLAREGRIAPEAVEAALDFWNEHLRSGIPLPNGEIIWPSLDDLYHAIVDPRVLRRPERIASALLGLFELRSTNDPTRRLGLCQWEESGQPLFGKVIIERHGGLRSIHVIDAKAIRKEQRKGVILWKR
ncbi:MAG: hypothetical protein NTZ05_09530 [Chloroflexi bacterium]|nr:hypothetical protein [Chloroflexota bacterium]